MKNWKFFPILASLTIFLLPVFYLVKVSIASLQSEGEIWEHLYNTLLPLYIQNTFLLMGGTGILATIFGVMSAWTVTYYNFPTRKYLIWLLFLPFAFPAYIIAYIYTDLLDYPGVVQTNLRLLMGWSTKQDYWFPEIRSLPGAIVLFSLVLYPYIFMFARKAFLEQSISIKQAAEVLGLNFRKIFLKISWPLMRPSVIVGIFLVMMETLADFGTVDYFSLNTLSLGAYNVWINMGSLDASIQISMLTLFLILLMILVEKWQRSQKGHFENQHQPLIRKKLYGLKKYVIIGFNWFLVIFGFGIPFYILFINSIDILFDGSDRSSFNQYLTHSWNSISLATLASGIICIVALLIMKLLMFNSNRFLKWSLPVFSIGYAMPGTILAIGIIPVVMEFNDWLGNYFFIGGSIIVIFYAYLIRFITIPLGSLESGYKKISENIYHSAKIFGKSRWQILLQLDLPLLKKCILTGFIIVFVDIMKELPLMIILRPLSFNTLATHVYDYASDENIAQASLSAMTIVLLGIIPIIFLTKTIDRSRMSVDQYPYVDTTDIISNDEVRSNNKEENGNS